MMQKCPKCGFIQPKDHYCAECGLNIDEYKPTAPAWHRRIAAKPLVLIAFICFGALLAGVLREGAVEPQNLKLAKSSHNILTPSPRPSKAKRQPAKAFVEKAQVAEVEVAPQQSAGVQPAVAGAVPPPPPPRPAVPTRVQLRFLEVPVSGLEAAYERGRELQGSAEEKALAVSFDKNISDLRFMGGFVLPGGAQKPISLKKSARLDFVSSAAEAAEDAMGLVLQITMLSFDDDDLSIELDASLRLQQEDGVYTGQLKELYRLRSSSEVLLVTGFLPRNKNLSLPSLPPSPLTLLQSEDFLNNGTEFVMLAQFK